MTEGGQSPPGWAPVEGVIADLDGVVYRGEAAIPHAAEAIRLWRRRSIQFRFVTNNSTRSAEDIAAKLRGFGIPVTVKQIVTSTGATVQYMLRRWRVGTPVHAIGSASLRSEIEAGGCTLVEREARVVVVGLDREITYAKLRTAVRAILAGATLIGTNPDLLLPVEDGFDPGAGALITAVATAARVSPVIIGKPETHMIEFALTDLGTRRDAQVAHARALVERGESPRAIARTMRVGKSTLYRALKDAGS